MRKRRSIGCLVLLCGIATWVACHSGGAARDHSPIDPSEVSPRQRAIVDSIGETLAETMAAQGAEQALLIDMASIYAPLDADQRAFLDAIRAAWAGSENRVSAGNV